MNRLELIKRVRNLTRDLSNSIFRENDIIEFLNEGVDRVRQIVPELSSMPHLELHEDVPKYLPESHHSLIALYATSRCFTQDERHYQATNFMNEFEIKMEEFTQNVESGRIKINVDGVDISAGNANDYVVNNYFDVKSYVTSFDYPEDEDLEV